MKAWNIKKDKVLNNMCHLYPYLWNQCILLLKCRLKTHLKYAVAKKIKDIVQLWLLIEEVCTSTSGINLVMQQALLKALLSLQSVYRENVKLSKYFEVFLAQAKVVWEADVNFGSRLLISHYHVKYAEKYSSLTLPPAWRNPLVKFESNLTKDEL